MFSAGALIWISVRPLLRLIICTTSGYLLTKADLFPLIAARGAGQIALNIAQPSLMFSKIVPAFSPQNAGAIAPLLAVAFMYQAIGFFVALIVKQFFWVPHRFRYGVYVAGIWSNWGDIPTSILMSVTAENPFNPDSDPDLAVAYVSVFILVYLITMFPMGGVRLVAADYVGPEVEDDEVRMSVRAKLRQNRRRYAAAFQRIIHPGLRSRKVSGRIEDADNDISCLEKNIPTEAVTGEDESPSIESRLRRPVAERHVSFFPDDAGTPTGPLSSLPSPTHSEFQSRVVSPAPTVTQVDTTPPSLAGKFESKSMPPSPLVIQSRYQRFRTRIREFLHSLLYPPALAILIALPIALIQPLKALFVPIPNSPIPNAPDGQPPLAFILDAATFIGAASVPIGLVCLGSALARLNVQKGQWGSLPIGAILGLAVGKMIVAPVLGTLITQGLIGAGVIDGNDKVLVLTCLVLSGLPTATTQVIITQVFSGTGSADVLSAFLLPQYAIMLLSLTSTVVYALQYLF